MAFMFENLADYQKAVNFAGRVAALTEKFPQRNFYLVDQLNRAALSIANNLAEGNGRFTKPGRRHFFTTSRGSLQECVPMIEIAQRRGLLMVSDALALKEQLEIIAKMLSGLISGTDKREA